jgi:hypothetical protein
MVFESFLDGACRYSKINEFQQDYVDLILDKRWIWENLIAISDADVEDIVIKFLRRWKIRNTQRIKRDKLHETLHVLDEFARILQNFELLDIDLFKNDGRGGDIFTLIMDMYNSIDKVYGIGPTSTSKILHGINPFLFMMWDNKIRLGYGRGENGVGYIGFLHDSQLIIKNVITSCQRKTGCEIEAAKEMIIEGADTHTRMSLVKLLDQYNFMKFARKNKIPDPLKEFLHLKGQ